MGSTAIVDPFAAQAPSPSTTPLVDPFAPQSSPVMPPGEAQNAADALIYSNLLNVPPSVAYQSHDAISESLSERLGGYLKSGWKGLTEDSITGEYLRGRISAPLESEDDVDRWMEEFGQMAADLPFFVAGAVGGGFAGSFVEPGGGTLVGAGAGGFGLTAAMRKWLVDKYSDGKVSSFKEIADVLLAGGKGALTGGATAAAGLLVPEIAGAGLLVKGGTYALRGAAEIATMTTVASALEGRVPSVRDFLDNSALYAGMQIGVLGYKGTSDYLKNTYVDSGVHPADVVANPETVKPPVEAADEPVGMLRPAIKAGEQVTVGEPGEQHQDILDRMAPPEEEAKGERTYEQVQKDIDDLEGELEKNGERAFYFKGGEILEGTENTRGIPYERMPPELESLYEERDAIGSDQLRQGVDDIVGNLKGAGMDDDAEIRHVLKYYALDPDRTDVVEQYLASQHTQAAVDKPLERQVEQAYIALASERGIPMDDDDDLFKDARTTRDAIAAVKAIYSYFHRGGEDKALPAPKGQSEPEQELDAEPEHGFVTPQGQFLSRAEASEWVEKNEPEVAKAAGDEGALDSETYNAANEEVGKGSGAARIIQTPEVSALQRLLAKVRTGVQGSKFGEALRTMFVGRRNAWIAETNQLVGQLREQVPDYRDQEALSLMRDFKNDPADLAARREKYEASDNPKLKKLVPIIDRALNPTPEMLDADSRMTEYFTKHLETGKKLGFLDSTISNEQYITHLLRPEETEEEQARARRSVGNLPSAGIGRSFPFAKERTYATILDAVESGKVKALSLNAFDAMTIYGQKWARAAATRTFINELKQTDMGKWGFKNSEHIPSDWVEIAPNSGLFRNTVPYLDRETGEPRAALQMLMVPPEVEQAMRPIIEGDTVRGLPGFATFRLTQAYIKAAELGLSVFHMKALNITALNNMGLGKYAGAIRADMDSPEFRAQEIDGIKAGLETPVLGQTAEAYRRIQPNTLSRMDFVRELPGIKQADAVSAFLTHETFDVIQRKFKVMDYSMKTAAWMADHQNASEAELFDAKRGITKEVNAAYGGLNWEVMGVSKNFRAVSQAILLAPDWTFSNILNLKYSFEGGAGGNAARAFWIRSTITGMALTQAMSLLVSGQTSSHPSEVYIGKDKYGKEVYSNMFFAGAPKDFTTWMNNVSDYGAVVGTAATIGAKLSPVVRTAEELQENRDWMGRQIVKRGSGALSGTAQGLEHIALETAPIPFSITDAARMLTDKEHDYGFWDYVSLLGGTPPKHVAPGGEKAQHPKKFSIRGAYR